MTNSTGISLLNAPSSEFVQTCTPYALIADDVTEGWLLGFNAVFCRIMLIQINKESDDALLKVLTEQAFSMPKAEAHALMQGKGSAEAFGALKILRSQPAPDQSVRLFYDVLYFMGQRRWKEAALLMHELYVWVLMADTLKTFIDEEQQVAENHKASERVTYVSVEVTQKILDDPESALKLIIHNPHYMAQG